MREQCLLLWPGEIDEHTPKEVHEAADRITKAGCALPIQVRMTLLAYHSKPLWKSLRSGHAPSITIDEIQTTIDTLLQMYKPWADPENNECNFKQPLWASIGLSDASMSEALMHEMWSKEICQWLAEGSAADETITAFCEKLSSQWKLPFDIDIGDATASTFLDCKRVCRALLTLYNPTATADSNKKAYQDAKLIEEAALRTEDGPTLLSLVGQSLNESIVWKSRLSDISKAATFMIQHVPQLVQQLTDLGNFSDEPSIELAAHLTSMLEALPTYLATLVAGSTDEFEAAILKKTISSGTRLAELAEDAKVADDEKLSGLLKVFRELFQNFMQIILVNDELRRIAKRLASSLSTRKAATHMDILMVMIHEHMKGIDKTMELEASLKVTSKHSLSTLGAEKLRGLFDFLASQVTASDMQASQTPPKFALIKTVVGFCAGDGHRDASIVAEAMEICTSIADLRAKVESFGDSALWQSLAKESVLMDFNRAVLRASTLHAKHTAPTDSPAMSTLKVLLDECSSFFQNYAERLVGHYESLAKTSLGHIKSMIAEEPFVTLWRDNVGPNTSADEMQKSLGPSSMKFDINKVLPKLPRATEDPSSYPLSENTQ